MDKTLNGYLEKIEKYLRPVALSERMDILKEIRSEMQELQENGVSPEQILERLGDPKELARAYLGECIAKDKGFRWRKLWAVVSFYSLAGMAGMLILPVTSLCGIAFMLSGILCPILGIIRFAAHRMGFEIPVIQVTLGSYTASAIELLPISIVVGVVLFVLGKLLLDLTITMIRAFSSGKRNLGA